MAGVFISYRREDSIAYAGRLYDRLQAHFGKEQVFMDIDTLKPGEDFVEAIQKIVASCDVLVAVIGKRWLTTKRKNGQWRLDHPEDFVRLEVVTALERDIRVIPILVGGAQMPLSSSLPGVLEKLARRHALTLPDIGFHQSVSSLIEAIEAAMATVQEATEQPKRPEGNFSTAGAMDYEELIREAARGNASAMTCLGNLFYHGNGVKQDYERARQWWEEAAIAENTDAMNNLGWLYYVGVGVPQDCQQVLQWWEKAIASGSVVAMYNLGWLHEDGEGVPQDYRRAHDWYEKAAAGGSTRAMNSLGDLYYHGKGVPQDEQQARRWWEKAAADGSLWAQERLEALPK